MLFIFEIDTIRLLKFTFFQMQYKNIKYNKPQLHQRCQLHSEQREEHQNKQPNLIIFKNKTKNQNQKEVIYF